jgi:hypothetical protein
MEDISMKEILYKIGISDEKKKYAENLLTRWFIIILKGDL